MLKLALLTTLAMLAFAGNSLLCRLALRNTGIDPATFSSVRLVAGALALASIAAGRAGSLKYLRPLAGSWISALALFAYAEAFSFAYLSLTAGSGALLLFGAVQISMLGWGIRRGERLGAWQIGGLLLAISGLVLLLAGGPSRSSASGFAFGAAGRLLPGLSAPSPGGALLMAASGVAWAVYSLRAKGAGDPTSTTAGNFLRAAPLALALSLATLPSMRWDAAGVACGVASGALCSGVGYAIWYAALRELRLTSAATVQLSVPVIAAVGGVLFLGESASLRLAGCGVVVLGGVAAALLGPRPREPDAP